MQLDSLRMFSKVAELASFTRAAEQLGMPKARVSTSIRQLETELGTRLLQRTTRTVRLTPDGEQFLERCKQLLTEADELQAMFQTAPSALRGRLRVDMPNSMARTIVVPRLPEFLDAHPLIEIELSTTDRLVDLIHEGFDCVLRVGNLPDSGLVARRIGMMKLVNCASPAYLRRHGVPRSLDDLDSHRLIHYATVLGAATAGWEYPDGERHRFRPMRGAVTVNNSDGYIAACLAGLGLIQVPAYGVTDLVAQGLLVEVMPEFVGAPMPVSLLYAHRHNLPKRLQAWIAWLAGVLQPQIWTTQETPLFPGFS